MKKKVLVSSILTIALCLSLIAGSTFALFTSTSTQNIAVTSGKVEMTANIEGLTLYSVKGTDGGAIVDENGHTYEYEQRTNEFFANGGSAIFDEAKATLTMAKVTPGDKVAFTLTGANASNVAIQYRYIIKCINGQDLMHGFNVYLSEGTDALAKYEALNSYTTEWRPLAAETAMTDVNVEIELPVTAGNEYQDLTADIQITVEAVQGNAVTENDDVLVTYIEKIAAGTDSLSNAIENAADGSAIMLSAGEYGTVDIDTDLKDVTIVGNQDANAIINVKAGATLDNVIFRKFDLSEYNGPASYAGAINVEAGANADITFEDCSFAPNSGYAGVRVYEPTAELTFIDCEFNGGRYGVYDSGAPIAKAEFIGCTFKGMSSWAIQFNGSDNTSTILIDGCTFEGVNGGIIKVLGAPSADSTFTFTNNTITNSKGHDNKEAEWFWISSGFGITVDNNTLDGAAWNPAAAQGLGR